LLTTKLKDNFEKVFWMVIDIVCLLSNWQIVLHILY